LRALDVIRTHDFGLGSQRSAATKLTAMWRQYHGAPATPAAVERLFWRAGKQHDALKKATSELGRIAWAQPNGCDQH